jgi:DNA primase
VAAIKQAVDLVSLVGSYLPLHRAGSKFKALCPFHDDHNPSLELNSERQSFKCWACGAGGDIFDFVQRYERVEFPEALRMLAERAGITLAAPATPAARTGPTKSDLRALCAWAEGRFSRLCDANSPARVYLERRGISAESVERFRLGYAPDERTGLIDQARREGLDPTALEAAGLVARSADNGLLRDRFRGRVIFPIHDWQGRPIAFGGRILPEVEARWSEAGLTAAKYLNSPETGLFHKRRQLYGVHLAREAARRAGWVAVVEGYTDVVAAHQVGMANVVGTLGTALGEDHVDLLRRLTDRAVLVFDGDEAGQKAAERALEIFLGHEIDIRVLTLPAGLDPCDVLLGDGAAAFEERVERSVDPLEFVLERAAARNDLGSAEGTRIAAEWALGLLARVPRRNHAGLDVKLAKALDLVASRLRLPVESLRRRLRDLLRDPRHTARSAATPAPIEAGTAPAAESAEPVVHPSELDPLDREIVRIVLNDPSLLPEVAEHVALDAIQDEPLRRLLAAGYDLLGAGLEPSYEQIAGRVGPAERSLAAGLVGSLDPQPACSFRGNLPPAKDPLPLLLSKFRFRVLERQLAQIDRSREPDRYETARRAYLNLLTLKHQRTDVKTVSAS